MSQQVEKLTHIFVTYGPKSKELKQHLEKFVYSLLHKYFRGWNTGCPERTEDILQEVYTKIYTCLSYFDPKKGNLATFLYRAILNTIKVYHNKENEHKENTYEFEYDLFNTEEDEKIEKNELLINKRILLSLDMQFSEEIVDMIISNEIEISPINKLILWRKNNFAREN